MTIKEIWEIGLEKMSKNFFNKSSKKIIQISLVIFPTHCVLLTRPQHPGVSQLYNYLEAVGKLIKEI